MCDWQMYNDCCYIAALLPFLWPNIFPLPISSSFYLFAGQVFSFFSFSVFFPLSILSYSEYFSSTPPLTIYFHPFPSPWRGVDFDQVFFSLFTLLIDISFTYLYKNGHISRKCWAVEYWNHFIFLNDVVIFLYFRANPQIGHTLVKWKLFGDCNFSFLSEKEHGIFQKIKCQLNKDICALFHS